MSSGTEFRSRELVRGLAGRIQELSAGLQQPLTFMEVCGTHTMAIDQVGLRSLLPKTVRLISGPGDEPLDLGAPEPGGFHAPAGIGQATTPALQPGAIPGRGRS